MFPANIGNCTFEEHVVVSGITTELQFLRKGYPSTKEDIIPYVLYRCDFTLLPGRFYTVIWFLDNETVVSYGPSNIKDDFLLHENTLLNFSGSLIGRKIKCSASLTSENDTNEVLCTSESASVPVAAELDSTTVYLSKSGSGSVKVKFTAPVGCGYSIVNKEKPSMPCKYSLKMHMKNDWSCSTGGIVNLVTHPLANRFCTEPIKMLESSTEWNGLSFEVTLDIMTTDRNYDDNNEFTLQLMFDDSIVHKLWKNFTFPDIKVKVMTENAYTNKVCYSHIDPHMRSSDQIYYEQHQTGTYMLYKNTKYDIEVQEQVKECYPGSRVRCACGVAIRAGKDVFMINLCGRINYMDFTQCGDGGILTVVQVSSSDYRVSTPIGTRIHIVRNTYLLFENTLNIDIFMAPKDERNVLGLCESKIFIVHSDESTVSNTYSYHDGPLDFVASWAVPGEDNLFLSPDRPLASWEDINKQFCVCKRSGTSNIEALCSSSQNLGCGDHQSITKKKCLVTNRKRRSSTVQNDGELRRLFSLMNQDREHTRMKRSDQSNITADEAAVLCSEISNSMAATDYADVSAGEDTNAVISQCIIDVVETNDASMVQVHIDAMNSLVRNIIELSPSYAANNTDKVEYFLANSCPANCSGNGICTNNGTCSCTDNYSGSDCSINKSERLIIDDIEGGGVCDIKGGNDCQCFTIRTDNLLEEFTCLVTVYDISYNGSQTKLWTEKSSGEYHDTFTGLCCVYHEGTTNQSEFYALKYEFAISNDGENYGNVVASLIYNSICQDLRYTADDSKYVLLKDGFCFIEQMTTEDTIQNNCLKCNPAEKIYDCSEVCNQKQEDGAVKIVLAIVLPVLIGVVVIAAVVCIAWKLCFKKKVTPKSESPISAFSPLEYPSKSDSVSKITWSLQNSCSKEFNQHERNPFPVKYGFERTETYQGANCVKETIPHGEDAFTSSADVVDKPELSNDGFFRQNLTLGRQVTKEPHVDAPVERKLSKGLSASDLYLN